MRTFVALDLSNQELKRTILSLQNRLVKTGASLKLVSPPNIHFTLRFLGDVDPDLLEETRSRLRNIKCSACPAKFVGLGAFPPSGRISVIWMGVAEESRKKMEALASCLNESLSDLSLKKDSRPFTPHLTIARVTSGVRADDLRRIIDNGSNHLFGEDEFVELKLKKSELTLQGPIYTDLEVITLS